MPRDKFRYFPETVAMNIHEFLEPSCSPILRWSYAGINCRARAHLPALCSSPARPVGSVTEDLPRHSLCAPDTRWNGHYFIEQMYSLMQTALYSLAPRPFAALKSGIILFSSLPESGPTLDVSLSLDPGFETLHIAVQAQGAGEVRARFLYLTCFREADGSFIVPFDIDMTARNYKRERGSTAARVAQRARELYSATPCLGKLRRTLYYHGGRLQPDTAHAGSASLQFLKRNQSPLAAFGFRDMFLSRYRS